MNIQRKTPDQGEEAPRYGEEHYRTLFDAIADAVVVHEVHEDGPPGRFLEVNSVACERLGYTREELLHMTPLDIDAPDSGVDINSIGRRVLAGETVTFEQVHVAKDGRRIPVEIRAQKFNLRGQQCVLSLVRDITERKQVEEALKESEYRLDLALKASGLAVWDYDFVTGDVRLSRHWWPILGYEPGEVPMRIEAWEKLTHPEDLAPLKSALAAHLKGVVPTLDAEYRMQAKSGEWRWIRTVGRVVERDAGGRALRGTGTHGDVTLRKEQEEKLSYLAYYDALTGAANRNLLNDRLAQAVAHAYRYGHTVAIAVLNLDHFKLINNSLGHTAGDELLKRCAARMRSCVRKSDTVARLGGDEFVLVLPGQSNASATSRVVSRVAKALSSVPEVVDMLQTVRESISEPMTVGERELTLTCSIGVSLYPQDGQDADTLLRNAAAALSRAKQLGRNNHQFYTSELNARIADRLSLHSELRRALERDEFTLYYQPKISLQTGRISGSEALLRWNKPGAGMVSPGEFIPVLEETGLIIDVGRWAMEKAVSTRRQWQARHARPPRIAVNVSQLQLAQKDFAAVVAKTLTNAENGAAGVDFEITETLIMQDIEANIAKLKAIREMGAEIAIDDFGTGHSSLSYLARLPVDTLKIDRAFITGMDSSRDSLAIVTAIISLSHSLGLKVVAEGVETKEQVKILRFLRCDEIQGYVVCRPLPEDQFEAWWKTYRPEGEAAA